MTVATVSLDQHVEHMVIAQDANRHLAFPDAYQISDGTIGVVYREGQHHVDLSGRIMLCRGRVEGPDIQFSEPQVVCDTDLDDRDPSVVELSDGCLLMNFFRLDPSTRTQRLAMTVSRDQGMTWSEPWDLLTPQFPDGPCTSDAVVELPHGELVMAVYGELNDGRAGSYLIRSRDQGRTWNHPSPLAVEPAPIFEEPAITLLPDGRLLSLLRSDHVGMGYIFQTVSTDFGYTWTRPTQLNLWGYPADLLCLSHGHILATYGYRQLPTGIRYCLADQNGLWSIWNEKILRCDGDDGGELGYPASVELANGQVLTVYYYTDHHGGQPIIAGSLYYP